MSIRLGLALGGGAARGLAHLGVLGVLRDEGIVPSVVTGTSFGALVGAATLCRGGDPRVVESAVCGFVESAAFRKSKLAFLRGRRDSVLPAAEMRAAFAMLLPDVAIESLGTRFGAVAADLESGEQIVFDRGSLRLAIEASSAIPGLLPPVRAGGRLCVDGGWIEKVPVLAARALGADVVIAVDVAAELEDTRGMTDGADVVHRADAVQAARFKALQLAGADAVISCDVSRYGWADFAHARDFSRAGRAAAREVLPRVRERLERAASPWGALRRVVAAAARWPDEGAAPITRLKAE